MRRIMKGIAGASVAAVVALSGWSPAHADPGHGKHAKHLIGLQIGCDNGQAYAAVMNGKGKLSAIHDVDSTRVLVPAAVSEALVTVLDADLNVVDQWTTPARAKRGMLKHHKKALTTCDVVGFSPQDDGGTITVQATMLAKVTPGH
jgi:hypothetical protein